MKKKTKMVLVPRSENTRAQKVYLVVIGLLIWINGIIIIAQIARIVSNKQVDSLAFSLVTLVLLCFVIGIWAIINVHPPLHYLVTLGAIINLIITLIGPLIDPQGIMSALLIYIGVRFPIRFEMEKVMLK
ncbi:MAG: hypothetical protein ACXAB7_07140 [Candidatus Kariarchaeaceae archaeon]|jgi:FtsH-binding integral membrane protein